MTEFKTYWIVDGVKHTNFQIVEKLVQGDKIAIEVPAERQQAAADERKRRAKANAIRDAEIREAAEQRAHERSPEGQREAAIRTALENPGGVVTSGVGGCAELDAFLPNKTSLLR